MADPAVAPPMRKNTSCTSDGSDALPDPAASGPPTWSRTGEFFGPASKIMPESFTPGTPSTCMAAVPFCGTRVGKPRPSTMVFGLVTTIGAFRS